MAFMGGGAELSTEEICFSQRILLAHEGLDAGLEVAGHVVLHRSAVEADDRLEQLRGQDRLAELLLLGDDLQQDQASDVLVGLVFHHPDLLALDDQLPDVGQGHVADRRVDTQVRRFAYFLIGVRRS